MEESEATRRKRKPERFMEALRALKDAADDVSAGGGATTSGAAGDYSPSLDALLALAASSDGLLADDPFLQPLSVLLSRLASAAAAATSGGSGGGILGRFRRGGKQCELSRIAGEISREIQHWIDRELVDLLVAALRRGGDDREALLLELEARLATGFDAELQHWLLRSGVFAAVEAALADPSAPRSVRDRCAVAALAFVRFNKDVFVGPVLMGPTVDALVALASGAASAPALGALNGLVAAIRSPLVDELLAAGELPRLVALLGSPDLEIKTLALEFALAIGYFGRKEAVDAMIEEGLVKRLLCLQRSELGGALLEAADGFIVAAEGKRRRYLEARPFASAVARFAVQVEVGEGLRQREKRAAKQEILRRVRDAAESPAEAATVLAEVLWGSTP